MKMSKLAAGIGLVCLAGLSQAAVIASGSTTGSAGSTTAGVPITFTGDASTGLVQAELLYDNTRITLTQANVTAGAAGFTCTVNQAGGRITILGANDAGALATGTICTVAYPINGGATFPIPLDVANQFCFTNLGGDTGQPCTATDGSITAGPVNTNPTLTYNPAAGGTVNFPAGAVGAPAATASIAITSQGAAGTGATSVTGCAVSGAGAAAFGAPTTTPANGVFNTTTTSGSINLTCTRAAAAATATLTCQETPSGGMAANRTWTLNCPAGTVPAPTYTFTNALTFTGTVGTPSANQNVVVTAAGGNAIPVAISTCAFGGTNPGDFAFNPAPTFPVSVAPGQVANLPVRFTAGAAGARSATLTCQTATANPTSFTVNLTGTGSTVTPVINSTPASGTTLTFPAATAGQTVSTIVNFGNTGTGPGTVQCSVPAGAGFTVIPSTVQTVAVGATVPITVTSTRTTPGTNTSTLTCTVQGAGGPFTFPLTSTFGAPAVAQIPTIGDFGRWALIGLVAGMGILVTRRRA